MMRKAFALLLAALVLSSGCLGVIQKCSGANSPRGPGGCCPGTYYDDATGLCKERVNWYTPTLLALLISFFIAILMFMLAFGFNMPPLLAWAKNEMYQVLATAVFVGAMFVIISVVDQLFIPLFYLPSYVGAGGQGMGANDAYQTAYLYLHIGRYIIGVLYMTFSGMNIALGMISSSSVSLAPLRVGITIQPGVAMRPLLDALAIALNGQGAALALNQGQIIFLDFIQRTLMPIFLPIGILLRTFPFTRSAGGALIAIAIGFYLVWPLTYVMALEFIKAHNARVYCFSVPLPPGCTASDVFTRLTQPMVDYFRNMASQIMNPELFSYLGEMFFLLFLVPTGKIVPFIVATLFMLLHLFVYTIVVLGFAVPAIQLLITFTFIRALANLMGADVNLQALSKIV